MASPLLDASSSAICTHGGQARPEETAMRVTLSGSPAVPQQPPWLVHGCLVPPVFGAGPTGQMHTIVGMLPCMVVNWLTATTRVKSMGQPLLLMASQSVVIPSGLSVMLTPGQTRVQAV